MNNSDNSKDTNGGWNISNFVATLALVVSTLTFSFSTEGKSLLCSIGISNSACPKPPSCTIGTGNTCDCDDFKNWRQAQWMLETYSGDRHNLDSDKDGIACEKLLEGKGSLF